MADETEESFEVRRWDAQRGWVLVQDNLTEKEAQRRTTADASHGKVTWYNTKSWFTKR